MSKINSLKISAGVVGGAGYAGGELIRLLLYHPNVEILFVHSRSQAGKKVTDVHQDLIGDTELTFSDNVSDVPDVLFLCMGHGKSATWVEDNYELIKKTKVIDLSRDFRLDGSNTFKELTFEYGLPEWKRDKIQNARYVANPGCFATTIQLALLPAAAGNVLDSEVHITGITGSTGAGQQPRPTTHFSWRNNNLSVYKAFEHQHEGEVVQMVDAHQKSGCKLNFIPIRGDFPRGIFVSAHFKSDLTQQQVQDLYASHYENHPFTHLTQSEPHLKQVVNTNKCLVSVKKHGDQVHLVSIIDNLLKGASGQAVQNMNLMFGLDEKIGLQLKALAF